ncbi:CS1 type fimbrial major subunit [Yersinia enterocolitica]
MKKTLLSMMTMAILASGSAYAEKHIDIDVTAEIPNKLAMTKDDGTELKDIKLTADPGSSSGEYKYLQKIKLKGNNSTNNRFAVMVTSGLSLAHNDDSSIKFDIDTVKLGNIDLQTGDNTHTDVKYYVKPATTNEVELDLSIVAIEPKAQNPGTYSGTLSLRIEETA